jgi:hypothetical protein
MEAFIRLEGGYIQEETTDRQNISVPMASNGTGVWYQKQATKKYMEKHEKSGDMINVHRSKDAGSIGI